MFGKADPYCSIRIGTQDFSTKPVVGGGKNPIWNEQFVFDISNEKELDMEVLGKFKSCFCPLPQEGSLQYYTSYPDY